MIFVPEIWPLTLIMTKAQNCHLFPLFLTKKCTFSWLFCNILVESNFLYFFKVFWCLMIQKDGNFVFWSMPDQMFIFLVSQNHFHLPQTLFWDTLYSSFSKSRNFLISLSAVLDSLGVTEFENKWHYAGRIRIYGNYSRGPWVTYAQVWYIVGIFSSRPNHFQSERLGLRRVTEGHS